MNSPKPHRERPPLDDTKLHDYALRYVGRFATTRAKLIAYLRRKVRDQGWAGEGEPDLQALAERFVAQGYVDDAGYALSKAHSLTGRGYGQARLDQALRVAGVADTDAVGARGHAEEERVKAALQFAKRKQVGPFAEKIHDPKSRERALRAMIRAGHGFGLSRAILALQPGVEVSPDDIADLSSC